MTHGQHPASSFQQPANNIILTGFMGTGKSAVGREVAARTGRPFVDLDDLIVPRAGKSKNKACFEVEPKHAGEGIINAVFLKDGNFVQLLTLKLTTAAAVT